MQEPWSEGFRKLDESGLTLKVRRKSFMEKKKDNLLDFLKNQEKPAIMVNVTITPTSCVQDIDTPANEIGVLGRKGGKEKFSVPKGVK